MTAESPIFVRGMSRSGGTLVVTILDAHPDVAMSYELYPTLLETGEMTRGEVRELAVRVGRARSARAAAALVAHRGLRIFMARCERSGVSHRRFGELLLEHLDAGHGLESVSDRLSLIGRICRLKMEAEGKSRWGLKCNNQYEDYLAAWPGACFLNVVRDGRDVLASQLNTGSFNKTPGEVGASWVQTHQRFREFAARTRARASEVYYEKLVTEPEAAVRRLAEAVGLSPDARMLQYYRKDLTIYRSNHLSLQGVSRPVSPASAGRWRRDLTPEQLSEFYLSARDMMIELGYTDVGDGEAAR